VGFVWFIVGVWVVFWLLPKLFGSSSTPPSSPPRARTDAPAPPPKSPDVYRPTNKPRQSPIKFQTPTVSTDGGELSSSPKALEEINDAFTGRRLNASSAIFECRSCHVYYQAESVEVLREANGSRCMVCGKASIAQVGGQRPNSRARNHVPDVVTLANYRQHIGRVITFSGHVHQVKRSRRGTDFAVMFERAGWTKGLKMVVFRHGARKFGNQTLLGYEGRTLTIRGLLVDDPTFGPEIIVDDPSMVVRVQ
jgi:hypothetical protein